MSTLVVFVKYAEYKKSEISYPVILNPHLSLPHASLSRMAPLIFHSMDNVATTAAAVARSVDAHRQRATTARES